jgi:DNA-binding IclR family transcriptional regulator
MPARSSAQKPQLKPKDIAFALGSVRRWKILTELGKGEPLPVTELARRTGFTRNAASKVLIQLHKGGLLERGYGNLYRIPARLLSANDRAIDLGPVVLRLDAPETTAA